VASEGLELLRSSVREFAEKVIKPVARRIARRTAVPPDIIPGVRGPWAEHP